MAGVGMMNDMRILLTAACIAINAMLTYGEETNLLSTIARQAENAYQAGSYLQALMLYQSMTNTPKQITADIPSRIGDCLTQLGRHEEAIRTYEDCLLMYPKGSGRNNIALKLADCYARLGQIDRARKAYENAFELYDYKRFDIDERIRSLTKSSQQGDGD